MIYYMAILGNENRLSDEFDYVKLFTDATLAEQAAIQEWGEEALPYITIEMCTVYA